MTLKDENEIIALCGHTLDGCDVRVLDNLTVLAANVRYRKPAIHRLQAGAGRRRLAL